MYQAAHGTEERRAFSRATLARIGRFAAPNRRRIIAFVGLSVVGAGLAVATPVLAGRVVDAIVGGGPVSVVVGLALAIAVIAIAESGLGVVQRWLSATLGEGLILDLRAAVFDHVQRQPVAFFTRTKTARWSVASTTT
jgi:ATP-binding cassette, subfamily B, bacterial